MIERRKHRFGTLVWGAVGLAMAPAFGAPPKMAVGPSVQVVVGVSKAAAARLSNPRETIVLDTEFYGVPKSERQRMALQGRLTLSPEQKIEIPGAGVARFAGPKYDPRKLRLVEGGVMHFAIEAYSGRHSSPNNLLDCDFFDESIRTAAERPVQIHCKLIGEAR